MTISVIEFGNNNGIGVPFESNISSSSNEVILSFPTKPNSTTGIRSLISTTSIDNPGILGCNTYNSYINVQNKTISDIIFLGNDNSPIYDDLVITGNFDDSTETLDTYSIQIIISNINDDSSSECIFDQDCFAWIGEGDSGIDLNTLPDYVPDGETCSPGIPVNIGFGLTANLSGHLAAHRLYQTWLIEVEINKPKINDTIRHDIPEIINDPEFQVWGNFCRLHDIATCNADINYTITISKDSVQAQGYLYMASTEWPDNDDSITINGTQFIFKDTPTLPNHIKIPTVVGTDELIDNMKTSFETVLSSNDVVFYKCSSNPLSSYYVLNLTYRPDLGDPEPTSNYDGLIVIAGNNYIGSYGNAITISQTKVVPEPDTFVITATLGSPGNRFNGEDCEFNWSDSDLNGEINVNILNAVGIDGYSISYCLKIKFNSLTYPLNTTWTFSVSPYCTSYTYDLIDDGFSRIGNDDIELQGYYNGREDRTYYIKVDSDYQKFLFGYSEDTGMPNTWYGPLNISDDWVNLEYGDHHSCLFVKFNCGNTNVHIPEDIWTFNVLKNGFSTIIDNQSIDLIQDSNIILSFEELDNNINFIITNNSLEDIKVTGFLDYNISSVKCYKDRA